MCLVCLFIVVRLKKKTSFPGVLVLLGALQGKSFCLKTSSLEPDRAVHVQLVGDCIEMNRTRRHHKCTECPKTCFHRCINEGVAINN